MSTESNYGSSDGDVDPQTQTMPLGESLSMDLANGPQLAHLQESVGEESPLAAASLFESSTRPTRDGARLLAASSGLPSLAYRLAPADVVGGFGGARILQAVRFDPEPSQDDADADAESHPSCIARAVARCPLGGPADDVSGIHVAVSDDGRMVAVACSDGSLRCYDVTAAGGSTSTTGTGGETVAPAISHRWTVRNAHSHVADSGGDTVSSGDGSPVGRSRNAAADAGPVRSLQFSPPSGSTGDHFLLLVDSSRGTLAIHDAASSGPADPPPSASVNIDDGTVSCACWCWCPAVDSGLTLAVGCIDSSIRIYSLTPGSGGGGHVVRHVADLDPPHLDGDDEGAAEADSNWCCTHLDRLPSETDLAAGFCRVTPDEDEEDHDGDDDDEDEDDPARHDVSFFVGTLTLAPTPTSAAYDVKWGEDFGGLLCPFFSVPRGGRHAFFTSFVPASTAASAASASRDTTSTSGLLLVASNLSSDVGVLARLNDDGHGGGGKWEYLDLEEGRNATTPTDAEDEYAYPTGLVACRAIGGGLGGGAGRKQNAVAVVVLGSTDGAASVFAPRLEGSSSEVVFRVDGGGEEPALNPLPVEETTAPSQSSGGEAPAPSTAPAAPFGGPGVLGGAAVFGSSPAAPTTFGGGSTAAPNATTFGAGGGFSFGGGGGGFGSTSSAAAHPAATFGAGGGAAGGGGFSFGGTTGGGARQQQPTADAAPSSSASSTAAATSTTTTTASSSVFGSGFGAGTTPQKKLTAPLGSAGSGGFAALAAAASPSAPGGAGFGFGTAGAQSGGFAALAAAASPSTPGGGTGTGFGTASDAASALCPPPFGAFVRDGLPQTSRNAPGMVKPLFSSCGGCGTSTEGKTPHSPAEGGGSTTEAQPAPPSSSPSPPSSRAAQKAARVFDSFDRDPRAGTLPASSFEALVDELGEGFHGDELDGQLRSVLAVTGGGGGGGGGGNGGEVIGRDAFVRWYVDLVEGTGGGGSGDDDASSTSSVDSDVAEEKARAEERFRSAAGGDASSTVDPDDFPRLMESMGTTYCEEEHRKTLKKITGADGRITLDAFVTWYVDWLFGDEEDDDESDGEEGGGGGGGGEDVAGGAGGAVDGGWGGCFAGAVSGGEGSWKCECCMVQNKPGTNVCAACETPRPGGGAEGEGEGGGEGVGGAAPATTSAPGAAAAPSSGIGSGGFTFGGGGANVQAQGDTGAAAASASGIGSGGFTFGGAASGPNSAAPAPASAPGAESTSTGIGSGGFTFGGASGATTTTAGQTESGGGPPPPSTGIGAGGFTFGGGGSATSAAPQAAQAGASGVATTTAPPPPRPSSSPPDDGGGAPPGDPSDSALRAMRVFDEMDASNTGTLDASRFESLLDELGEGFHGEELSNQLSLVIAGGTSSGAGVGAAGTTMIERGSFVAWYANLVDGGGDEEKGDGGSTSSSLDSDEREEREEETANALQAFDRIAPDGGDSIPVADFGELMESMGTTYCEEEHRRTIGKIGSAGRISRDAFVAWYIDWLFNGDEEEESDADGPGDGEGGAPATTDAPAGGERGGTSGGWGACFGQDAEGSWKCGTCMVLNGPGLTTCAACESPRPGHEGGGEGGAGGAVPVDKDASDGGVASSGIGSGGFTFGGIAAASGAALSDDKTGASVPAAAATFGSGGFSFLGSTAAAATTMQAQKKPADDSTSSSEAPSVPLGGKMPPAAAPAATSKAGAASGYPPMATKAPSAFTGFGVKTAPPAPSAPAAPKPAGSGGYPPMAGKAPTPFGGGKKATTSSSSSSDKPTSAGGYPPMSAKAPSPSPFSGFGSQTASSPAPAPAGSGGFPPMAGKAPTPFSGTSSTTSAGGFPPMSTKAPSPFSGFGTKAASSAPTASSAPKPTTGSGGYPPMAGKAPTPFSAASSSGSSDKPPSAGGYPPMSMKAPSPSPFSGFGSQTASSPAPMAGKAPAPFSGTSSTTSSAGGFPPMSTKAPSPFSGSGTKPASSAPTASSAPKPTTGSGGYPPMAGKAPTPFSAASSSGSSDKPPSAGGYPPMSMKAPSPSPFSGFGSQTASSPAPAPAGSGGFPPMTGKAPTPFSDAKATAPSPFSAFGAKAASPAPAPAGPKPADGSGGYPPIAGKAPTPFGGTKQATASSSNSSDKPSSAGGYPPMSAKAPKPSPFSGFGAKAASTSAASAPAAAKPPPFKASSPYEAQVYDALTGIESSLSSLRRRRKKVESSLKGVDSNSDTSDFQNLLQSLVEDGQKIKGAVATAEDSINSVHQRSIFLLSQRDDIERQVKESRRLLDEQLPGKDGASSYSQIIQKQPLDLESEKQRRRLASMSVQVQRGLVDLRERVRMSQRIFHLVKAADDDDRHIAKCLDKVRDVGHDDRSSPRHEIGGKETRQANTALFYALKKGYEGAKEFETTVDNMETQLKEISKMMPLAERSNKQGAIVSFTSPGQSKSSRGGGKGPRITPRGGSIAITARPLDLSSALPAFPRPAADDSSDRLSSIENEVRKIASAPDYVHVKKFARSCPVLPGIPKRSDERQRARQWRQDASSQLMNTPDTMSQPRDGSSAYGISTPSYQPSAQTLFRSPSTEADSRYGYRSPRSVDRARGDQLVASIPAGIREINASDAARKALASFGTTPEKVSQARETVARGAQLPSRHTPQASSERGTVKKAVLGKKTAASEVFPPLSTKAPTPFAASDTGAATKAAAPMAFPPLPAKPPTPFSKTSKDSKQAAPVAEAPLFLPDNQSQGRKTDVEPTNEDKAETKSSIGKSSMQSTSDLAGGKIAKDKSPLDSASSPTAGFSFGDVSAFGDALAAVQKPPSKEIGGANVELDGGAILTSSKPPLGKSGSFLSTPTSEFGKDSAHQSSVAVPDASPPDYRSMLVSFYERHNPAKVGDVAHNLEKYKGKEAEMFAKLAAKYNVSNPLIGGGKPPPSPAPAPVQTSPFASLGSAVQLSAQSDQPDYRSLLFSFYQKYNPTKVGDVEGTLIKYKGKETELFAKLANKYKVPNPLMGGGGFSGQAPSTTPGQGSPFLTTTPASPTPFGAAPSPSLTPFGSKPPSPSPAPFGSKPPLASSPSPFGNNTSTAQAAAPSSPFGAAVGTAATFGPSSTNQSPFASSFGQGSGTPPSLPFGASAGSTMTSASPFGSTTTTPGAAFGSATSPSPFAAAPVAPPDPSGFGGRNPRDILVAFYQQYNASKVAEVDKLLAKYAGKEEQLFRNLAKKYNLDEKMFGISPAAPASSVAAPFASAQPNAAQQSTFGGAGLGFGAALAPSPSPFSSSPSPGGFGQPSSLGGNSAPAVGSAIGSSPFGGSASPGQSMGFGSLAACSGPGTTSSFSSPAAAFGGGNVNSAAGFGSGSAGFGGTSPSAGFGSYGATGATGGFGGATPFGSARR